MDLHLLFFFLSLCFECVCIPCLFRSTFIFSQSLLSYRVRPSHLCDCVWTNRRNVQTELSDRKRRVWAGANQSHRSAVLDVAV